MTEKLLLEIIIALLACLFGLLAWLFRQHAVQHAEFKEQMMDLSRQRLSCNENFATKNAVKRAHERIDEQQITLNKISTRVTKLEGCRGEQI